MPRPVLVLTMGDPAGVGPQVAVACAARPDLRAAGRLAIAGDPAVLAEAARRYAPGLALRATAELPPEDPPDGSVPVLAASRLDFPGLVLGRPTAAGGRAALEAVRAATDACLAGRAAAMVTAPVSKEAIEMAGEPFTGHTEWIAARAGQTGEEMMLMASPRVVVSYVTTHLAIRDLPDALERGRILRCLRLTAGYLVRTGRNPRLAVCGLNPHAGEHGLFGREEEEVIAPAVAAARAAGVEAEGPLPADTVFVPRLRERYGAVVCMYHDQGGIPFKMLAFEDGVNITLGLRIVRTSVDHGTAWDLAWKTGASPESMAQAVLEAARLAAPARA